MGRLMESDNEVSIEVKVTGNEEGTPVIYLHGRPAGQEISGYDFPKPPSADCRFIRIGINGIGESDEPSEHDYGRAADELHSVIESLRIDNAVLVGISTAGAIAAQYMARQSGERIAKLLLIGQPAPEVDRTEETAYYLS